MAAPKPEARRYARALLTMAVLILVVAVVYDRAVAPLRGTPVASVIGVVLVVVCGRVLFLLLA